jgi:hypothetical protein
MVKKTKKMEKLSIKDIFTHDEPGTKPETQPIQENSKDSRMARLAKALDQKNEVYKGPEDLASYVNQDSVNKEFERFRKIARLDETAGNAMNTHPQGGLSNMNAGQNSSTINTSVNTFMGDMPGKTVNTFLENPNLYLANKNHNPNYTYLRPSEALRLSIVRTLNSGAPVAKMGFYEEVNWNLNNLGFDSKSPLDIKQMLLKIVQSNEKEDKN